MATRRRNDLTAARDLLIVQMRRDGLSYREIGDRFGVSEARVCQIVTTANRPSRGVSVVITAESPIYALPGLGTRELRCIERAGIRTVGELQALNDNEMLAWPGFGRLSLGRVRRALRLLAPLFTLAANLCCAYATAHYARPGNFEWIM